MVALLVETKWVGMHLRKNKKSKQLNNKNVLNLIVKIAIEFGFPRINLPLLKAHLGTSVQLLVPAIEDFGLLEQAIRYNLQIGLKSKNKEKPEEIPYQEGLEFMKCFFMKHPFWKITRFIRRRNPTISFYLAITIPTISMVVAIVWG